MRDKYEIHPRLRALLECSQRVTLTLSLHGVQTITVRHDDPAHDFACSGESIESAVEKAYQHELHRAH